MDGLLERPPASEETSSNRMPIVVGMIFVVLVVGLAVFLLRTPPKTASGPPPYAANVKISDFKMSAAENFVGASVSYIEGTVTNSGDKTLTHAVVHVVFKDSLGQIAQADDVALHVIQIVGPYADSVDLSSAPLTPGQSKPFRLTFEHITSEWNHEYPELRVIDVSTK